MYKLCNALLFGSLCLSLGAAGEAAFQSTTPHMIVRVLAEVLTKVNEPGRQYSKLVAADRVVPGDLVFYTLEVRNEGPHSLDSPVVVQAVPAHMVYVANSALGPGCEVAYSLDGGHTFDKPANLMISLPGGGHRSALAADYTHIRFQFGSLVKPNSTAFLRFSARVK